MGLKWECPADQTCSTWALSYFSDCVCSRADMVSFFLGITSIVCWAVSEAPQILVNWRSPSTEGVSLAFIFTWMIGDIFNLTGCWINPGTLPTQFYLAVLYTATTLILVVQQMWSAWMSYRNSPKPAAAEPLLGYGRFDGRPPRWFNDSEGLSPPDPTLAGMPATLSLPARTKRVGRPLVQATASLPVRPYSESAGTHSRSWRRLTLLSPCGGNGSSTARGLIFSSLVIVGVTISGLSFSKGGPGFTKIGFWLGLEGDWRQLLQEDGKEMAQSVGLILGWFMTCIYLTGRLPQVILNWSRDFVIGVSLSTAVFAFLGNATYLGSILVRSVKWTELKLVLPWVVDIFCCLLMDFFMMFQFLIHRQKHGYITLE